MNFISTKKDALKASFWIQPKIQHFDAF